MSKRHFQMDYSVKYIFKQNDIGDDGNVLLFHYGDAYYLLHWFGCCLQFFKLKKVDEQQQQSLQEINASRKNQQFTPDYKYSLKERIRLIVFNDVTNSIIILNLKGGISITAAEKVLKIQQNDEEMDYEPGDIFNNLLAQSVQPSNELNLESIVTVSNVFTIKTVENYLYVISSASKSNILTRIYLIERNEDGLRLSPKFKQNLGGEIKSDAICLPENFTAYQELNSNLELPGIIFSTSNGLILCSNPSSATPSLIYDLKQRLAGVVHVTLPKTTELSTNNLIPSSQPKYVSLNGDCLCFVGENGRVSVAIPNNTIKRKCIEFTVGQLSINVVFCTSFQDILIAASEDHILFFKLVCKCKIESKHSPNRKIINVSFSLLKEIKIPNVNKLIMDPLNPGVIICHNTAKSIMVVNLGDFWVTKEGDCQKDPRTVTSLLKVYEEQKKENELLKNESVELNKTLIHLSIVGEWVKSIKKDSKSCFGIDKRITVVRSNSKKLAFLTLSIQNKSKLAVPAFCSINIQYQSQFQPKMIKTETIQLNTSPPTAKQSITIELSDRFMRFSPIDFNTSITFSLQTYQSISLPLRTFTVNILDFCDISPTMFSMSKQMLAFPKTYLEQQNQPSHSICIKLDPTKFDNNKDAFCNCLSTCLNIEIKKTKENFLRYNIEYIHGETAEVEIKLDNFIVSVSTKNVMFLASLHHHFSGCLKEFTILNGECGEETKQKIVESLKELSSAFTKNITGQDSADVISTLSKFYSLQRQ
ncbi:uncharacterized protein [Clytia hemisphaerica]|uniref:uncharacterized protein n=1 Tax=Clytia hemisphaerica TaxID=252671 RepID=UPI0034D656F2